MNSVSKETTWDSIPLSPLLAERHPSPEVFPQFVAAYLPFNHGEIDWDGFRRVIARIYEAGCVPVINADTGWAFLLSPEQKRAVVSAVREWHPDKEIVVGVTPGAGADIFDAAAYSTAVAAVKLDANVRIMVMVSEGLLALRDDELIAAYGAIEHLGEGAILHELTSEFVPFGREFTPYELHGILSLPAFSALKTSALSGPAIPRRVQFCRQTGLRQKILVLSGVDWKVREAFECADGILMGAAVLFPRVFTRLAELRRASDQAPNEDARWRYEDLVSAVQSVVSYQFLPGDGDGIDVGNYRHLSAMWLENAGLIASAETPPQVEDRHRRLPEERHLVRRYEMMLREVIASVGEDPDELLA